MLFTGVCTTIKSSYPYFIINRDFFIPEQDKIYRLLEPGKNNVNFLLLFREKIYLNYFWYWKISLYGEQSACFVLMIANIPDALSMFQGVVLIILQTLNSFCSHNESMGCLLPLAPFKKLSTGR